MQINVIQLKQWADTEHCRSQLPVLLRQLVYETDTSVKEVYFPGGESVNTSGFDGEVESDSGNIWVPKGNSFWELGCGQNPRNKLASDYNTRLDTERGLRNSGSFIFVTPRIIDNKRQLEREYQEKKDWHKFKIIDGNDLEYWLEKAPLTTLWLREKLGLDTIKIETPTRWWTNWATVSNPQISKVLVTNSRINEFSKLLDFIKQEFRVISVKGENREESVAFVIATIILSSDKKILNRTWVIKKGAKLPPGYEISNPILICDYSGEDVNFGDREKVTIIRTDHSHIHSSGSIPDPIDSRNTSPIIPLSPSSTEKFTLGLKGIGLSEKEADKYSVISGNSIPVLRRFLSVDTHIKTPVWANDQNLVNTLLPFALVGAWNLHKLYNDAKIIQFLGDIEEKMIFSISNQSHNYDEYPIAKNVFEYEIISKYESLFVIKTSTTIDIRPYLGRFFDIVPQLLNKGTLPSGEVRIMGDDIKCSDKMISGIRNTLCILAIYGDNLFGNIIDMNVQSRSLEYLHSYVGPKHRVYDVLSST